MATYSTDFSTYTSGQDPGDWVAIGASATHTHQVIDSPGQLGGKVLSISVAAAAEMISSYWNVVPNVTGNVCEVVMKLRRPVGDMTGFARGIGAAVNMQVNDNMFDHIRATLGRPQDDPSIVNMGRRLASDLATGNNPTNVEPDDTNWFWVLVRTDGSTKSAWFWGDGQTPKTNADTPDLTATNTNYSDGFVGFTERELTGSVAHTVEIDYIGVGTDADAAPMPGGGATPPTVDAGTGGAVTVGTPFSLNATVTPGSDAAPTILWSVQSGPGGSFSDTGIEDPTFTPSGVGATTLLLTVTPNDGPAVTDTVVVTATAASVTSITVAGITGGANLTGLQWTVFSGPDMSIATILDQGSGETTDANGDLFIELTPGPTNGAAVWYLIKDVAGNNAAQGPATVTVT